MTLTRPNPPEVDEVIFVAGLVKMTYNSFEARSGQRQHWLYEQIKGKEKPIATLFGSLQEVKFYLMIKLWDKTCRKKRIVLCQKERFWA